MSKLKQIPLFLLLCAVSMQLSAQQRIRMGFWNVENLYDTIPSPFYDDRDYTPEGRNKWDTERYNTKLTNLARTIDDAGFDVLGLAEVENETVVRDLINASADYYNYIHFNSSDSRGMDLALIYKGDKFYPIHSQLIDSKTTRQFLHVQGVLLSDSIDILLCHLPSKNTPENYRRTAIERLAEVTDSLQSANPAGYKLFVMGDFNSAPNDKIFRNAFGKPKAGYYDKCRLYEGIPSHSGAGTYVWRSRWMLFDNILLSEGAVQGDGLIYKQGGVFIKDYMLDNSPARRGYPLRTFTNGNYTAGFSDHLPVFTVISQQ